MFSLIDVIKDERVNCYSALTTVTVKEYLKYVENAYKHKQGGIEGQRGPLKTKTAQRVRARMIDDLIKGSVIPPIVVGISTSKKGFENYAKKVSDNLQTLLENISPDELSIIDGMQRTTALFEAVKQNPKVELQKIRVEFWIAQSTNSLVYRMLVLNAGQIPWNLKRQIEVVFSHLKKELETKVKGLELFTSDDEESRAKAGQYQASQFIELYMLFGTKRISIDVQEELADEFARLDLIDSSGNDNFTEIFFEVSQLLVDLDIAFSKLTTNPSGVELQKFKAGKYIFSSQPARVGFISSMAQEIFGMPGVELTPKEEEEKFKEIKKRMQLFLKNMEEKSQDELSTIIDLPTLDENIRVRASKVGEFERNYFHKAFRTFIDLLLRNNIKNFTPCWRATL